jgi:uncharacterized protein (DUF952 family)
MSIILHITKRDAWTEAQTLGSYRAASLDTEGFIHCSTSDQLIAVANFIFRSQSNLVILEIDETKVVSEIRFEIGNSSEDDELLGECSDTAAFSRPVEEKLFPHIYGPLNLDAVTQVVDFDPLPDGTFELPESLSG